MNKSSLSRERLSLFGFLKGAFKVVIGLSLLVQSLLFILVLVFALGVASSVNVLLQKDVEDLVEVPDGGALVLNPVGMLTEVAPPVDPFEVAFTESFGGSVRSDVSVHSLVEVVRAATTDDRITTLVLDLQGLFVPAIYASKAHYLADEIGKFRAAGKRVIAIGDMYSQEQYLIASEADTVLMHHMGGVFLTGYGSYRTYFKEAIDSLKVTSHVFRVGTFKSALEPYLRSDMSPEAKLANQAYLNALWDALVGAIAANRELSEDDVRAVANNAPALIAEAGGDLAQTAVNAKLVDRLLSRSDQVAEVAAIVGADDKNDFGFRGITFYDYRDLMPREADRADVPDIAVVTAAGPIVDGSETVGVAAGDVVAEKLRRAREDDAVKAVVLRVDSPGGSAMASEIIRGEVLKLKEAGKPVVVSMGSLAASGGYWISADADEIIAAPTTLTGSIGVFSFLPTLENTIAEVGIYTDGVGTTSLSGIEAAGLGPLPADFSAILQANVEHVYDEFLTLVSQGRGISKEEVDAVGQGRVWMGQAAEDARLVDSFGTLDDAIAAAAARAALTDYDVRGVTAKRTKLQVLLDQLGSSSLSAEAKAALGRDLFGRKEAMGLSVGKIMDAVRREAQFLNSFDDPRAIYVRCLMCPLP